MDMVLEQCPDANGATLPPSGSGACYCEFGMTARAGTGWQTCLLFQVMAASVEEHLSSALCDGGWQLGDGIGGTERSVGLAISRDHCLSMVTELCPDANGATLSPLGYGTCYCEFGMTDRVGTSWQSCLLCPMTALVTTTTTTIQNYSAYCQGGWLLGDSIAVSEKNIGNASSSEDCIAMVFEQCPDANGATFPPSGLGPCYCKFGMTGRSNTSNSSNTSWQSCLWFESAYMDECIGGGWQLGDGIGGWESNIGNASSRRECMDLVLEQCPDANGATLPPSGAGACYCEFGMTARTGTDWQTCLLSLATTSTTASVNGCPGGWQLGDGTGGIESFVGSAFSHEHCLAMVMEHCPNANGATLPPSGSGACYCEFGMTGRTGIDWQSCVLCPATTATTTTTQDNLNTYCEGGWQIGDGTGGPEMKIGSAISREHCVAMVMEQCPNANGATLPPSGSGDCYCEFEMAGRIGNGWQSCLLCPVTPSTTTSQANYPAQCAGGWAFGDGIGGTEREIGFAISPEHCLAMVFEQCPGANGATLPPWGSGACYCEFGMTGRSGTAWQSCLLSESSYVNECLFGGWQLGDGVGGWEKNIGIASSRRECMNMVSDQCPFANGATLPSIGSGLCYCEFGMLGRAGSGWQTCLLSLSTRTTTTTDCTDLERCAGGWQLGQGSGGVHRELGFASSRGHCLAMVAQQCPDANGASLAEGSGTCYCHFGVTGRNGTGWQSCMLLASGTTTAGPTSPPTPSATCEAIFNLSLPVQNNLGGLGPDSGVAEMRFQHVLVVNGHAIDLKIVADVGYEAHDIESNVPKVEGMGQIGVKTGTTGDFTLGLFSAGSDRPVAANFSLSLFDIDGTFGGGAMETVFIAGFSEAYLSNTTEIYRADSEDGALFTATGGGSSNDKPISSNRSLMTKQQIDRSITAKFEEAKEVKLSLGSTGRRQDNGRIFWFMVEGITAC